MPLYRRWRWSTSSVPALFAAPQKDLEQAEKMRSTGEQLIADDHYAVDSIRPKCIELQRMCEQYKQLLRRRRELLSRSHDLHDRIDRANKWCSHGMDLLASQHIERCQTREKAEQAVREIENFRVTASELKLNNPKEFRQLFESMITPETRASVQKVLKRIEDVQGMCEKKKEHLQKFVSQHSRPVQHVRPEVITQTDSLDPDLKRKVNPAYIEKSARLRTEIHKPVLSHCSMSVGGSSSDSTDGDKARHSYSSMSTSGSSISDLDTLFAKRKHVLNELITTEKTYVAELCDILQGYHHEMDSRSMQHLIPNELRGKRDILFGNLEQLYNFHNNIFLQELQNCRDAPSKVGKCFANRKKEFQMYSIYCQNKPQSEALRVQAGDNNPFFKECQRRLGHKLPLGAYLLKPIQRITKYQLLLKEMLRFTDNDQECESLLQEALDTMLNVLKYLNDSMHQVQIVGFKGNLADLGQLLMQGSFNVWTEHKKEKIKDLRFKPMIRHVFLYEKALLFCKRKEDGPHLGVYSFKNMLKLAQVGLTETIKGDRKKFELWLRGREEVYIIQAPSLPVKDHWIKEVKKVLMNQFDQLKVTQLNLIRRSMDDLTHDPMSSNDSSNYEAWERQCSSGSNPTVPQGLEMLSPESPPDNREEEGWSSGEFTNSEEDEPKQEQYPSPVEPTYLQQFVALADYDAVEDAEMSLREADIVEVLRQGTNGWWLGRHLVTNEEGWIPSTYLEPLMKKSSRSHFSVSSMGSSAPSQSSLTSGFSAASPVDETTV